MTRIRSPRELRLVLAQTPSAGAPAGDPSGDPAGARFGELFARARQAFDPPEREPRAGDGQFDEPAGQQRQQDDGGDDTPPAPRADPPGAMAGVDGGPAAALAAAIAAPPRLALPGAPHDARRDASRDSGREAGRGWPARRGGPGQATRAGGTDSADSAAAAAAEATRALGAQLISHCARATGGQLVADHLAERIAHFCTDPALERTSERWEVMVKLDPAILPHSKLHLVLSDGTLSLRFDCDDTRSRQLICDNGDALRSRLEALLGARIVVQLEVN